MKKNNRKENSRFRIVLCCVLGILSAGAAFAQTRIALVDESIRAQETGKNESIQAQEAGKNERIQMQEAGKNERIQMQEAGESGNIQAGRLAEDDSSNKEEALQERKQKIAAFFSLLKKASVDDLIAEGKWEEAILRVDVALAKNSKDVKAHVDAFKIFENEESPFFDLDSAYIHISKAKSELSKLSEGKQNQLAKKGISKRSIQNQQELICERGWTVALADGSIEGLEHFLNIYRQAPKHQKESISERRNELAFAEARKANTIRAYESFLKIAKKGPQATEAQALLDSLRNIIQEGKEIEEECARLLKQVEDPTVVADLQSAMCRVDFCLAEITDTQQMFKEHASRFSKGEFAMAARSNANAFPNKVKQSSKNWVFQQFVKKHVFAEETPLQEARRAIFRAELRLEELQKEALSETATSAGNLAMNR